MNRFAQVVLSCVTLAVSAAIASTQSLAGTVDLWGDADGDTTYVETFSDGFIRVDLYDPPPRQTQQRFHSISNPSVTFGSLAYDGFPNDEHFRMGRVTYDESGLIGGNGVAPITAFVLGVARDPFDANYHNYYRWLPTDTVVDSYAGTVTVSNGQPTAINLESEVHLEVNIVGNTFTVPGTFEIAGDRFDGKMSLMTDDVNSITWDLAGTLTTLAPPAALGDFDGNGVVNGRDFLAWQRGESPTPFSSGDLIDWQTNYSGGPLSAFAVPEPGSLLAVSITISFTVLRRRQIL